MKKHTYLLMSLFLVGSLALVGCNKNDQKNTAKEDTNKNMAISSDEALEKEGKESEENKDSKSEEKKEEKSVVAGTVAVAEILDALGQENVVGVPETRYGIPEKYKDSEKIGKPMEPDMEIVKSLNPDLFVSVKSLEEVNKPKLEQNDINYKFLNLDSVEDIKKSIEDLAKDIGKEEKSKEILSEMDKKVEELSKKSSEKESPRVLFLFGTPKSIMIGTENSYVGNLMKTLNIHNVANDIVGESNAPYLPINMEDIVSQDVDVIIRMTHADPEQAKAMLDKEFENEVWQSMKAVKEGRVIDLDNRLFSVSGSINFPEALENLYNNIYEQN